MRPISVISHHHHWKCPAKWSVLFFHVWTIMCENNSLHCLVFTTAEKDSNKLKNNRHWCMWCGKLICDCLQGEFMSHYDSPGSSTTTRGWTPAGSWTEWWWPTWTGPICASISPATTGWSREEADNLFVRDLLGSMNPMDVPKCRSLWGQTQHTQSRPTRRFTEVKVK